MYMKGRAIAVFFEDVNIPWMYIYIRIVNIHVWFNEFSHFTEIKNFVPRTKCCPISQKAYNVYYLDNHPMCNNYVVLFHDTIFLSELVPSTPSCSSNLAPLIALSKTDPIPMVNQHIRPEQTSFFQQLLRLDPVPAQSLLASVLS